MEGKYLANLYSELVMIDSVRGDDTNLLTFMLLIVLKFQCPVIIILNINIKASYALYELYTSKETSYVDVQEQFFFEFSVK